MMFIACRGDVGSEIKDILRELGLRDFEVIRYCVESGAWWVGVCANRCLRYDEEGVEEYDYEECGVEVVESALSRLLKALRRVSALPAVGLAAITNVPGTWPWGPVTVTEPSRRVRIYAIFIAHDAPRTPLEDRVLRSLLFKTLLLLLPEEKLQLAYTLSMLPFVSIKELIARGGLYESVEEVERGVIIRACKAI